LNEFLEIGTALADGTERLRSVSDSPMLDAELLLARAIDVPRTYLIAHPEDTLDPAAVERFFSAVERRSAGMPIAYISGEKEFWSMTLNVSPDTLVPRPETEVLVDHALQRIPDIEGFSVLDLGTGSGAIALAIARDRPNCDITATGGDWSEPVVGRTFDMIVSNPPYVASADPAFEFLAHEPRLALAAGEDGLAAIRRISIEALSVIRKGGHLLVEHGETQYEEVVRIFSADGWDNISHANDLAGKPRVTIATGQAN
jgi:release factor glutamine methyltransferase